MPAKPIYHLNRHRHQSVTHSYQLHFILVVKVKNIINFGRGFSSQWCSNMQISYFRTETTEDFHCCICAVILMKYFTE
jgi:hypothetical protein